MKLQYSPLLCLMLLLPMQGCQPSTTIEQTESYARQLNVINQFEISRWHNRQLPVNQKITVITDNIDGINSAALSELIAAGLQPYFQQVVSGDKKTSIAAALALAKKQYSNVVIFVESNNPNLLKAADQNESQQFRKLQLILTVADVESGKIIDKIQLRAKSPFYSVTGQSLISMLSKPIAFIGQQLSGQDL